MSEAYKAMCRRHIDEVWNNRKLAVADELFAPNYVDHDSNSPELGRGAEGVKRRISYYLAAFPDARFTAEDILAEGDRCVVRWSVRGTHRGDLGGIAPTGRQIVVTGITIYRIAEGKFVESWINWDTIGMMQQLGVAQRSAARKAAG